jgi:streptogramin lyase
VYAKANGKIAAAIASSIVKTRVIGLAMEAIVDDANGDVLLNGCLEATAPQWEAITGEVAGLTIGAIYYLDDITQGKLTKTPPAEIGGYSIRIGQALTSTIFEIEIQPPVKIMTESKFPAWRENGNYWTQITEALDNLPTPANYAAVQTLAATSTDTNKWLGGVLAPNMSIYGVPFNARSVLKINTENDEVTTFGTISGTDHWAGGVLAPNGMIYCSPAYATAVLKIDPTNDSISTFGTLSSSDAWYGCILANNGMIYCAPGSIYVTDILKINPTNDSISFIDTGLSSGPQCWGGVIAPDGCIYFFAYNSNRVVKIDPVDDSVTDFAVDAYNWLDGWNSGVTPSNGKLYGIPADQANILVIDPTDDSQAVIGPLTEGLANKYMSGALAPDGKIYCPPLKNEAILVVNPFNDSFTTFGTFSGSASKYAGANLARNGYIYCIPFSTTNVIKIGSYQATPLDFVLSRHFNKL